MRYLVFSICVWIGLSSLQSTAFAQTPPENNLVTLGNGMIVETIPAKYVTIVGETPEEFLKPNAEEWIVIPAVYETVTETIILEEGFSSLKITPAIYSNDGVLLEKAVAIVEHIPPVTRDVSVQVVKTPAKAVKRTIPNRYHPPTLRQRVKDEIYIIRDEKGVEIQRYEDPSALVAFVNGL